MNWKRATIAMAVTLPLIALLGWGMTRDPKDIPTTMKGRVAPTFALPVFAEGSFAAYKRPVGDTVRLSAYKDTIVVLNYWASWCVPCRIEHPTLTLTSQGFGDAPVRFVSILFNDTEENGRRWIEMMGGQSYPALSDPGAKTAISYGVYGVPETYFIDGSGHVVSKHTGPITADSITFWVDSLLRARGKKAS